MELAVDVSHAMALGPRVDGGPVPHDGVDLDAAARPPARCPESSSSWWRWSARDPGLGASERHDVELVDLPRLYAGT